MTALITILIVVIVVALIAGPIILFQIRRILREQKNYERGLKMVLLLIQLPPPSEDIQVGSRDERDVVEENVSKAQTLYSIVAGTLQKGFKTKIYGQRHFAFEIVASNGLINFYATVPVALIDVVKQAISSAYPAARVDEVYEQNIFSPVGKLSGTIGGELSLKESFAYPIATYQEVKTDAMQTILNSLSTLDKEDSAGIQILIRPATASWRKIASGIASQKRKGKSGGKSSGSQLMNLSRQIVGSSPADGKSGESSPPEKLSNLDQAVIDAIEDKTRYPGFEVLIRVIASSNINQRADSILRNVVSSFALFDSPGKNGFKYTAAKDMERFVTAYILRFFPPENNKNILNSTELASIFHFPDRRNIPTSQLERQASKQVDGPRNVPENGLLLGYNLFRGVKKAIRLDLTDRQRHVYVVGQTGTGKSTFLENLALQDMLNGGGFAFVDPHGDVSDRLLAMVPKERTEDVIYFSPADMDFPMGLNLFEYENPDQKDFLIQEAINMLYKLYDPQHQGIMGPRYEHLFRMAALTVMADPAGGTFIDIPKLFRDPKFVQQKLKFVKDQNVLEFWQKEVPQSQRSNEYGEVTSWFVSKFGAFLSNEMMRNIIGQTKSAFDLREIMDQGKILLVNLSKGRTGELNSKLLGMVFVMKFQAAAMSRANIPEDERKDFCLYVDEFQNFSTDSFATIMSEARKYHLNLVVANQFTTQLSEEVRDAVLGNIGTVISFRVGQNDVDTLTQYFQPLFDGEDLLRIPNFNTIARMLINGVPTQPFSMATLPALGKPNEHLSNALKQLSAAKYGHPRSEIEKTIFDRLKTIEEPKPAFNDLSNFYGPGAAGPGPSSSMPGGMPPPRRPTPPPSAPGTGSFLDEWLKKRQAPSSPTGTAPLAPPPAAQPPFQPVVDPFAQPKADDTFAQSSVPPKFNTPSAPNPIKEDYFTQPSDQKAAHHHEPKKHEHKQHHHKPTEDLKPREPQDGELVIPRDPPTDTKPEDTIYIDTHGNLTNDKPEDLDPR